MAANLTSDAIKARLSALDAKRVVTNFSTWDLVIGIQPQLDGRMLGLDGEFDDWPEQVKVRIMDALVRDCDCKAGHRIAIVASGCFQDVPWEPCYIRVIVQEFPDVQH